MVRKRHDPQQFLAPTPTLALLKQLAGAGYFWLTLLVLISTYLVLLALDFPIQTLSADFLVPQARS